MSELLCSEEYECKVNVENKDIKRVTSNVNLIEKDTLFVFIKGINKVAMPMVVNPNFAIVCITTCRWCKFNFSSAGIGCYDSAHSNQYE